MPCARGKFCCLPASCVYRPDAARRSRSLATLLSLSAPQASLSPAMSHTSLSSMMNPGFRSPLGVGAVSPGRASLERNAPRTSPFAFSLSVPINHVDHRQEEEEAQQWEEAEQELSEEAIEFYSSGSDEGTQLGPRPSTTRNSTARAIPIPPSTGGSHIRGRSQSDSLPNPSTSFSPLQSRPLALGPSSASPPVWSRRRRRRGQRRSSLSPAPATPEERFRARARGTTDAEDDEIEPGESQVCLLALSYVQTLTDSSAQQIVAFWILSTRPRRSSPCLLDSRLPHRRRPRRATLSAEATLSHLNLKHSPVTFRLFPSSQPLTLLHQNVTSPNGHPLLPLPRRPSRPPTPTFHRRHPPSICRRAPKHGAHRRQQQRHDEPKRATDGTLRRKGELLQRRRDGSPG